MPRVGVKYCGHCNPLGDGLELTGALEKLAPDLEFYSWGGGDDGVLLVYSACAADCVSIPVFDGPVLHVVGSTLNGKSWKAEEFPREILRTLRELLEKSRELLEKSAEPVEPETERKAIRAQRGGRPQ